MPKRLGVFPHDSTSNQLWVDSELHSEANAELLRETAKELKDQGWLHIYTRVVSLTLPIHIDLLFILSKQTWSQN